MNDAFDAVEDHARELEEEGKKLPKGIENDNAHLDPSRWWLASAAFPLAAGCLGPVASAFSICALVRPWREHIVPGFDITKAEFHDDPTWLLVANAIQLAIALLANVFLLLNMARRVRFTIAQPITIVGWYLSSLCLIALSATAAGPLQDAMVPRIEWVWSQAFYYGIFAAILYMIVASLMVVTFWGAQAGKYDKDFQLTPSQRTLMLQTIMFLMYLLIGALIFCKIEGWAYLDAVYWADVTLFTVGFGDISASTPLGRALLFPYALVGVISLGLVIGSIRSLALERGKRRLDSRMIEKRRRRYIKRMTKKGKDEILEPIPDGNADDASPASRNGTGLTEYERRGKEFDMMRNIQRQAERRRRWTAMGMSAGTWLVLWLVGAAIFQQCEVDYQNWTYFDGFYFAFVSLTTIGYGDITPVSNSGKAFFVFWSLLALPTMTVLISNAGDTIVKSVRDATDALGSITILPGERGLHKDFKSILKTMSFGKVFDEADGIQERPPGFLGAAQPADGETDEEDGDDSDNDDGDNSREKLRGAPMSKDPEKKGSNSASPPNSSSSTKSDAKPDVPPSPKSSKQDRPLEEDAAPNMPKLNKSTTGRSSSSNKSDIGPPLSHRTVSFARTDFPKELPKSRTEYHCMLIGEIQQVTRHLKHQPPRKYTFQEWAWYLKLVGEDEHSAETHRKARPHMHDKTKHKERKHHGEHAGEDFETKQDEEFDEEKKMQWSWVGMKSPLMGSQEEAEWILDKLTARLQAELKTVQQESRESEGKAKRKGPDTIREHPMG